MMNVETLFEYILYFEEKIIESGFKRDLQDFIQSLPNNQNNIVALRDIAEKVYSYLKDIYTSDLPDKLNILLPAGSVQPFTSQNYLEEIENLLNDTTIQLPQFFQKLNSILTSLNNAIQQNINELQKLKAIFTPYIKKDIDELTTENKAILALIFKHHGTITSLKHFSTTLRLWNRNLLLYHQIITSKSPEDIRIIEVQNSSIDLIINLDVNVAINLVDVFEIGLKAYLAYLTYKTMISKIVESYFGNEKLIKGEEEREKELLNNIELAVENKMYEQHKEAAKSDNSLQKNIDKIINEVKKLIVSHIINGNDLKLLALPRIDEEEDEDKEQENVMEKRKELERLKAEIKERVNQLPKEELRAIEDKYSSPELDDNNE